ncbi:MAG: TIGR00266 family protein, partial [Planctomycetes bacterium]|nr:TIGR00266 family protein [Planctomycetota bacterium]
MIINTFTANDEPGEIILAPGIPGDLMHYELDSSTLYLQRGAFLAHSEGVEISGKWRGAKGFFSGQGLVLLKATGTGDLFFNSFGAILEIKVFDEYIVDTGYIVAFEDTLEYKVSALKGARPAKTIKNFLFGGEGLVCRFRGEGKVWVQTRYVHSFLSWVYPFRPVQQKS